jgi:hypothetical protein
MHLDVVAKRCEKCLVVAMQLADVLLPSDACLVEAGFESADSRGGVKRRRRRRWGRRRRC